MSGMINKAKVKVEEMLHKDSTTGTHSNTTATGAPHNSHAANTIDPTVHSGNTHTANTTGGLTGHSTTATGGPHSSHAANTVDPTVNSGHSTGGLTGGNHSQGLGNTTHGTHGHNTANNGPHDSAMANKLDPRVDSTTGQYGSTGNSTTGHSTTGGYGNTANNGPHNSSLLNKADPRVDSDNSSYGQQGYGNTAGHSTGNPLTGSHQQHTAGGYGNTAGHSTGNPLSSNTHHTHSANNGPHDSSMANKADPRVDSDNSSYGQQGYGNTASHSTGNPLTGSHQHNTTGHHQPSVAGQTTGIPFNEHQQTHQHGTGAYDSSLPGPAPSTAGPHKSNLMNKMDPRVDADLDGSKTVGGNKTYQQ